MPVEYASAADQPIPTNEDVVARFGLSPATRNLMEKYTRKCPAGEGECSVWFVVGVQYFRLACDFPPDEADGHRVLLAKALARMLAQERWGHEKPEAAATESRDEVGDVKAEAIAAVAEVEPSDKIPGGVAIPFTEAERQWLREQFATREASEPIDIGEVDDWCPPQTD